MKLLYTAGLLLPLFYVYSGGVQAGDCQTMARELTMTAWSEVLPDLSAAKRSELQELASEICARHLADDSQPVAKENGGDWFTEYVLEGKPADKPGNRRLERRSR